MANWKLLPSERTQQSSKNPMALHVFAIYNEPYFYKDDQYQQYRGIEYSLVKTIAEKLKIHLSVVSTSVASVNSISKSALIRYLNQEKKSLY